MFVFYKSPVDLTSWKDNLVMTSLKGQMAFDGLEFGMEAIGKAEFLSVKFCYWK